MPSRPFERFAGVCAGAVGAGGLGYAIVFVVILNSYVRVATMAAALFLLVGGVLSSAVMVALYGRLRDTDAGVALWALVLGLMGSFGSAIHGGWDLAILANKPVTARGDLPNAVDPRGLLTFGFMAMGILAVSWLIVRGNALPRGLGYLGAVAGILLLVLYLGRLIILSAKNPVVLTAALLSGFVVNPVWFVWLGIALRREPKPARSPGATTD